MKRNIGQARDGGDDITVGPLVVECKRRKTLGTVYAWLQQATKAASEKKPLPDGGKRVPIVVGREDNGESLVILRLTDFLILTRDELKAHVAEAGA